MTKKSKMRFSKWIVLYCVLMGTIITAATLIISYRSNTISSGIITALLIFWGGELMILCLTKILGDKGEKSTASKKEKETTESSI